MQGQALNQAEHWLFDPAHKAENLDSLDLSSGALTLSPQSMTLLILAK